MARLLLILVGLVFLGLGILFALIPFIPLGVPFMALSLICFIPASSRLRGGIKTARTRWRGVDKFVNAATRYVPKAYRPVLRQTDPSGF
ncbi:MAG: hypothetical protein PVF65_03925 [Sphingomonadales bacterium]|jgi:uncharacterized membrane protein YbaN (DUF454 family)